MKHLLDEISVNHYGLCNINIKAAKIDIATVTCICAALHYAITPVLVVRSKNINRIPVAVNIKQHDIARIKKADNILGVIRIRGCSETGTIRINHLYAVSCGSFGIWWLFVFLEIRHYARIGVTAPADIDIPKADHIEIIIQQQTCY